MRGQHCALLMLLALGCSSQDTGEADPAEEAVYVTGQAPWDPVYATRDEVLVAPDIDGLSAEVALSTWDGEIYAWRTADPLSVGEHTVSSGQAEEVLEILPYGASVDFSAEDIVGRYYALELESGWASLPKSAPLMLQLVEGVWLQIEEVDGEQALLRAIVQLNDNEPCVALRTRGALSSTGELTWGREQLDMEAEQGDIPLWEPALRLGWLPDGSEIGGVEVGGLLKTDLISSELFPQDDESGGPDAICDALVEGCATCPDGDPYCVQLQLHAAVAVPAEDDLGFDDLPRCGLDIEEAEPVELDIDIDCGALDFSCAAVGLGLFGLTGAIRRRRRRGEASPHTR